MRIVFKKVLLAIATSCVLAVSMGLLMWLATARAGEFYLYKSIRGQALISFWLAPPRSSANRWGLSSDKLNVSVWLSPKHVLAAIRSFDIWIQEYSLLRELSDEAVQEEEEEGYGYLLPPSLLPEDEPIDASIFLEDSYDLALRQLLDDIWHSGLFVIAGAAHFPSPFCLKPGIGWLSSGFHPRLASSFFDTFLVSMGDRNDGADVPSWFTEIPFAHLELKQTGSVMLQESVLELGGEQLASLHTRLCDLGHLPDSWCQADEDEHNPLEALLYATEDFKVQFKFYWQIRGDHLVWSNHSGCLLALVSLDEAVSESCGLPEAGDQRVWLSHQEKLFFKSQSDHATAMEAGVFIDQQQLHNIFELVLSKLESGPAEGASWLSDALHSSWGMTFVEATKLKLIDASVQRPRWGARFVWEPPEAGELSTLARFPRDPDPNEHLSPRWAETQFNFLYGLLAAWRGLPDSPGQIQKIEPWQKKESFWNAVTHYRLGWSESQ